MPHFLENDITEQQKYEKIIQTSVDNTVINLHHEIKFENSSKNTSNFFIKQNISFLFQSKIYIFFILGKTFLRVLRIQLP